MVSCVGRPRILSVQRTLRLATIVHAGARPGTSPPATNPQAGRPTLLSPRVTKLFLTDRHRTNIYRSAESGTFLK
jgi:hypothetical protein